MRIRARIFTSVCAALIGSAMTLTTANAATVLRKYQYFPINGTTASDLDRELGRRGPILRKTGARHPGMTRMRFDSKVKFASTAKNCRVVDADIIVHANVYLPRWKQRRTARTDLALIWDTLSADIKRHEESHIAIAHTAAGDMERRIKALHWRSDCVKMKADVDKITARLLKEHDAAQVRFDRVESINFDARFERLLAYRIIREFGSH
jgi:predicted secreted Zn-dependent protease